MCSDLMLWSVNKHAIVVVVVEVVVVVVAAAVAVAVVAIAVAVAVAVVVCVISDRIKQWYRNRKDFVNTRNVPNIETLLHSAGGHQESRKAHQADNQNVW